MSDLCKGWAEVRLADIAEVRLGRQRSPKNHSGTHMRPYLRAANVDWNGLKLNDVKTMNFTDEEAEVYRLQPGDIVLGEASGSASEVGKPALWNGEIDDCCFQNTLLRVRSYGVDQRFLLHYLRYEAVRGAFAERSRGVGIHHLGAERLANWLIYLPPLGEQQRIVAALEDHLSRVDAGSVYLNQAGQQESQLRIAIYTAAVEGRLIASPRAGAPITKRLDAERQNRWRKKHGDRKCKLPIEPDLEIGPFVPDSWHVVSLEAATDPARLIQYGILMPRVKTKGSVPYVEVKDLAGETLSGKNLHRTSQELDEQFSKSRLAKNDVVMAVRGSYERSAVVPDDLEGANVSRDVVRIAPLTDLDPDYLHIYLQSAFSRRYFAHHARGVAVKGVNTASVRSLPIVIPPLEAQHQIVREVRHCISAVNRISTEISYARKRASNLRKSLLAEAFAGRLVPQDPTDQPAVVLLEWIRAEQAAQPRARRGRRTAKQAPQGETLL